MLAPLFDFFSVCFSSCVPFVLISKEVAVDVPVDVVGGACVVALVHMCFVHVVVVSLMVLVLMSCRWFCLCHCIVSCSVYISLSSCR